MKIIGFSKNHALANRIFCLRVCFYFCSTGWNSELFSFPGTVRNRIPSVCFCFCSRERNSELFSLRQNDSKRNSESLLLFLFHAENSEHFSPLRNGSERNSESFLFRRTAGIPPEQANCSVYSVFRGIIFCRKLPTLCSRRKYIHCLGGWRKTQKWPQKSLMVKDHYQLFMCIVVYTVRKMDLILRPIERRPQMQFSMARRFKLQLLRRYSVKFFSKMRNFTLEMLRQD